MKMKKIFKRIVTGVASFLVTASLVVSPVFADNLYDCQTPDCNAPDRLQRIDCIVAETTAAFEATVEPKGGATKVLSVPLYQQINNYYCGPASVQMVLKYLGDTVSQSTLGSLMNTTPSSGTYVYQIANGLNSYLGSGQYAYIYTSELSFGTKLFTSIDAGYPIICHTQTRELPHYNGHESGHYVVAIGYSWAQGGSSGGRENTVTFNDPNNNSNYYGKYTCKICEMTNAINANAGLYIAH